MARIEPKSTTTENKKHRSKDRRASPGITSSAFQKTE